MVPELQPFILQTPQPLKRGGGYSNTKQPSPGVFAERTYIVDNRENAFIGTISLDLHYAATSPFVNKLVIT